MQQYATRGAQNICQHLHPDLMLKGRPAHLLQTQALRASGARRCSLSLSAVL